MHALAVALPGEAGELLLLAVGGLGALSAAALWFVLSDLRARLVRIENRLTPRAELAGRVAAVLEALDEAESTTEAF